MLLTGNDISPANLFQTSIVITGILMGSIANANIFGNMALIISNMNQKTAEF